MAQQSGVPRVSLTGNQIMASAQKYTGVPYFEGNPQGVPPAAKGFDCSGIVQRALADLGVNIARTTTGQLADANSGVVGENIGTDIHFAQVGDIIHYVGHEEIWDNNPAGQKGPPTVFSEAVPGTAAGIRPWTGWPVIGIVRYATAGVGPVIVNPGQIGGDPGKVSGQLVDIIPGATTVVGAIQQMWSVLSSLTKLIGDLANPNFWKRAGLALLGLALLLVGLRAMNGANSNA